jgi:hypothetical protein
VDVFPLKESVLVLLDEKNATQEFTREDLIPWDELEALRKKSQAPCDRHENGGCSCGKADAEKAAAPAEPAAEAPPVRQTAVPAASPSLAAAPEDEEKGLDEPGLAAGARLPERSEPKKNRGKPQGRKAHQAKKGKRGNPPNRSGPADHPASPPQPGRNRPPRPGKREEG